MFIYTHMDRKGTAAMLALGLPFVITSVLVGASFQGNFIGSWLVALLVAPLAWSFAYSKALGWFLLIRPAKPMWWFPVGALLLQGALIGAVVYAAA